MKTTTSTTIDTELYQWVKDKGIPFSPLVNELLFNYIQKQKNIITKETSLEEVKSKLDEYNNVYHKILEENNKKEEEEKEKDFQAWVKKDNLIVGYQDNILTFFDIDDKEKAMELAKEFYDKRTVDMTLFKFMTERGYKERNLDDEMQSL